MLSFSRLNLRLLAAKAKNINKPNAKNAITPTVMEDIVATEKENVRLIQLILEYQGSPKVKNVPSDAISTYFQYWDPLQI